MIVDIIFKCDDGSGGTELLTFKLMKVHLGGASPFRNMFLPDNVQM